MSDDEQEVKNERERELLEEEEEEDDDVFLASVKYQRPSMSNLFHPEDHLQPPRPPSPPKARKLMFRSKILAAAAESREVEARASDDSIMSAVGARASADDSIMSGYTGPSSPSTRFFVPRSHQAELQRDSSLQTLSMAGVSDFIARILSRIYNPDPFKNWENALRSIFIIEGTFEDVANGVVNPASRRKSYAYFIFTILQVFRFVILIALDHKDERSPWLYVFGSVYYPLGEGGRVTYIALAFAMFEMVIFRLTFITRARKKGLTFMKNIISPDILHGIHKRKFENLFQKAYILFRTGTSLILYFGIADSLVMGYICASREPSIVGIVMWIIWSLNQCMVMKAFTNMVFVTGFWYSSVLHLKIQLDQLRDQLTLTKESRDKYLTNFHFIHIRNNYQIIGDRIQDYNKTSRYLILAFNYCSAPVNTALFYGAMKTTSVFSLFFMIVGVVSVSQSVFLLSTATLINHQARKLYVVLNSVFVVKREVLSHFKRKQLRRMIYDTGSESTTITLRTYEGAPVKPESFLTYVLSSFTLLIMLVDFSHQFFSQKRPTYTTL